MKKRYYLLDTNIISEVTKLNRNEDVVAKIMQFSNVSAISAVTWAELWKGVYLLPDSVKREAYENFLREEVSVDYEIVPFEEHAALLFGKLEAETQKKGKKRPYNDLQIAATAISNNLILVTRNTKDFEYIPNLMIENWFESA